MPNFLRNFEDNENLAMVLHKVTLRVLYTALYALGHITVVHKWVWVLGKFFLKVLITGHDFQMIFCSWNFAQSVVDSKNYDFFMYKIDFDNLFHYLVIENVEFYPSNIGM